MLRPKFKAGITELGAYDFTYDILIYHYQLDQAIRFVKLFPEQKFVLTILPNPILKVGIWYLANRNQKVGFTPKCVL
jgi:L-fuconolactonase